MIHVEQMLSDYATVYDGKLVISGAGINVLVGRKFKKSYVATFGIGLLIKTPIEDTKEEHRLIISVISNSGEVVKLADNKGQVPEADVGKLVATYKINAHPGARAEDELIMTHAFQFYNQIFPHLGSYTLSADVDEKQVSYTRFNVVEVKPQTPKLVLADL